jgi:hypothetical protein
MSERVAAMLMSAVDAKEIDQIPRSLADLLVKRKAD